MKLPSHAINKTTGKCIYIDIAETALKKRCTNHKRCFNLALYKNDTELSNEFWKIKRKNYAPLIEWRVLKECSRFNHLSLRCNLYLNEKLEIAFFLRETTFLIEEQS